MPASKIETTQHFEWETSWNTGFLIVGCALLGGWILWQLLREGKTTQSRWPFLFVGLRGIVVGVLVWMLLGPTSVLIRTESHPQTLAVYVDSSSSMEMQDQPDNFADLRWITAAGNVVNPMAAADRAVLYSAAMRQQLALLTTIIEQQESSEVRVACAANGRNSPDIVWHGSSPIF